MKSKARKCARKADKSFELGKLGRAESGLVQTLIRCLARKDDDLLQQAIRATVPAWEARIESRAA